MLKYLPHVLILVNIAFAASNKRVPPLAQKRIHNAYKEGEFDLVEGELEKYAHTYNNQNWLREDSVFLYKHLAVVYTASPETREKGKYYMISMLRIMPSAEILDMYVSEEVDRIFMRTRQEFIHNMTAFGVDSSSLKIPTTRPSDFKQVVTDTARSGNGKPGKITVPNSSNRGWKVAAWTAAGLSVAAAGTYAFFLIEEPKTTEKINTIQIPKDKN